jgi:hypothetical protein
MLDVNSEHLLKSSGDRNSENLPQLAYIYIILFSWYCGADSPSVGLTGHFVYSVQTTQNQGRPFGI